MSERSKDEMHNEVIQSLFKGETLAAIFIEVLNKENAEPVAVSFAIDTLDRIMTKNMPKDWREIRTYTKAAFDKIEEAGLFDETEGMKDIPEKFEKKNSMIVKVQIPIATSHPDPVAMVYNEDRSYEVMMAIDEKLLKDMKGTPKKFFHAHYDRETNDTILEKEAKWQTW